MDPTHASDVGPDVPDVPDPAFWGPEPRSVRRSRRAAPPRITPERTPATFFDSVRERLRDTRVEACLLTVGDGVMLVRVKG